MNFSPKYPNSIFSPFNRVNKCVLYCIYQKKSEFSNAVLEFRFSNAAQPALEFQAFLKIATFASM